MENKSWLLLGLCVLILTSCGPSWHLRQAIKHERKAIALGAAVTADTVFIDKEVIVPEIRLDSFVVVKLGDTIRLEKEKLKIKLVKMPGDTVFIDAACLPDTVKVTVPVTVEKKVEAKGWLRWWHLVIVGVCGAILGRFFKLVL